MPYKALTRVGLPVFNDQGFATGESVFKEIGDSITKKEMDEAHQSPEDLKALIQSKAIEEG